MAALSSSYHQQQQQLEGMVPLSQAAGGPIGIAPGSVAPSPYNSGASGSRLYEMMSPPSLFGQTYAGPNNFAQSMGAYQQHSQSPYMTRYGYPSAALQPTSILGDYSAATSAPTPRGLIGGPNLTSAAGQQALPYALVPAPSTGLLPFGEFESNRMIVNRKRNNESKVTNTLD